MPPKSISMPARGSRTDFAVHSTPAQPTSATAAAISAAAGSTGGSRLKSHTRRSTPDVMSKSPPDSAWHWSA